MCAHTHTWREGEREKERENFYSFLLVVLFLWRLLANTRSKVTFTLNKHLNIKRQCLF